MEYTTMLPAQDTASHRNYTSTNSRSRNSQRNETPLQPQGTTEVKDHRPPGESTDYKSRQSQPGSA